MRIRIMRSPTVNSIEGIRVDRFEVGRMYDVAELVGAVLIAEGWARLARVEPAIVIPLSEIGKSVARTRTIAADRPRRVTARKKR